MVSCPSYRPGTCLLLRCCTTCWATSGGRRIDGLVCSTCMAASAWSSRPVCGETRYGTWAVRRCSGSTGATGWFATRSEEHTSELQSHSDLVCRLLLEKKKKKKIQEYTETAIGKKTELGYRGKSH